MMSTARDLAATLTARHMEAHELLERVAAMVDSVDPDTADWGHAGDLGYIVERLRDITGDNG